VNRTSDRLSSTKFTYFYRIDIFYILESCKITTGTSQLTHHVNMVSSDYRLTGVYACTLNTVVANEESLSHKIDWIEQDSTMEFNYGETPAWAQPSSPQNQSYGQHPSMPPSNRANNSYYGSPTPVSGENTSSNTSYYGAPNPVSPSNDSHGNYYASPSGVSASGDRCNNHYASPALSPGDWNTPSPNNPSPTQHTQYSNGSPKNDASSPSSARSAPFMYSSAPQKLDLPRQLGAEKSELDIGREKVAGARALCLMQETFDRRSPQKKTHSSGAARRPSSQTMDMQKIAKKDYPRRRFLTASKEKLATSNRKKKTITHEEDFENISDFKCQLDVDRQKDAQNKALKMLSYF
jgi:hypothetical protein